MSKEKTVDYIRCPECSYVYEAFQDKCPQCGKDTVINEELLSQEVFNLNDQDEVLVVDTQELFT